jgi:hypothetical protein
MKHFDIGPIRAPDEPVFRMITKVLPDVQPAAEVDIHLHVRNAPQFNV